MKLEKDQIKSIKDAVAIQIKNDLQSCGVRSFLNSEFEDFEFDHSAIFEKWLDDKNPGHREYHSAWVACQRISDTHYHEIRFQLERYFSAV